MVKTSTEQQLSSRACPMSSPSWPLPWEVQALCCGWYCVVVLRLLTEIHLRQPAGFTSTKPPFVSQVGPMTSPSWALLGEAHVQCLVVFSDHEALNRDSTTSTTWWFYVRETTTFVSSLSNEFTVLASPLRGSSVVLGNVV